VYAKRAPLEPPPPPQPVSIHYNSVPTFVVTTSRIRRPRYYCCSCTHNNGYDLVGRKPVCLWVGRSPLLLLLLLLLYNNNNIIPAYLPHVHVQAAAANRDNGFSVRLRLCQATTAFLFLPALTSSIAIVYCVLRLRWIQAHWPAIVVAVTRNGRFRRENDQVIGFTPILCNRYYSLFLPNID